MKLHCLRGDHKAAKIIILVNHLNQDSHDITTELQISYLDPPTYLDDPHFKEISPHGKTPVLEFEDGDSLFETNTILRYLIKAHSRHQLLGSAPKQEAKVDQWMEYSANELDPILRVLYYPYINLCEFDERFEEAMLNLQEELGSLETTLSKQNPGAFLVGNQPTLADLTIAVSLVCPFKPLFDRYLAKHFPCLSQWLYGKSAMFRVDRLPRCFKVLVYEVEDSDSRPDGMQGYETISVMAPETKDDSVDRGIPTAGEDFREPLKKVPGAGIGIGADEGRRRRFGGPRGGVPTQSSGRDSQTSMGVMPPRPPIPHQQEGNREIREVEETDIEDEESENRTNDQEPKNHRNQEEENFRDNQEHPDENHNHNGSTKNLINSKTSQKQQEEIGSLKTEVSDLKSRTKMLEEQVSNLVNTVQQLLNERSRWNPAAPSNPNSVCTANIEIKSPSLSTVTPLQQQTTSNQDKPSMEAQTSKDSDSKYQSSLIRQPVASTQQHSMYKPSIALREMAKAEIRPSLSQDNFQDRRVTFARGGAREEAGYLTDVPPPQMNVVGTQDEVVKVQKASTEIKICDAAAGLNPEIDSLGERACGEDDYQGEPERGFYEGRGVDGRRDIRGRSEADLKVRGAGYSHWEEDDQGIGGTGLDKRKNMGNCVSLPTGVKFNSKPVNEETDDSVRRESAQYHQEREKRHLREPRTPEEALTPLESKNGSLRRRNGRIESKTREQTSLHSASENIPPINSGMTSKGGEGAETPADPKKRSRNSSSISRVKESVKNIFQGEDTPSLSHNTSRASTLYEEDQAATNDEEFDSRPTATHRKQDRPSVVATSHSRYQEESPSGRNYQQRRQRYSPLRRQVRGGSDSEMNSPEQVMDYKMETGVHHYSTSAMDSPNHHKPDQVGRGDSELDRGHNSHASGEEMAYLQQESDLTVIDKSVREIREKRPTQVINRRNIESRARKNGSLRKQRHESNKESIPRSSQSPSMSEEVSPSQLAKFYPAKPYIAQSYKTVDMCLLNLRANFNTAETPEKKKEIVKLFEDQIPDKKFFEISLSHLGFRTDIGVIDRRLRTIRKEMITADVSSVDGEYKIVGCVVHCDADKVRAVAGEDGVFKVKRLSLVDRDTEKKILAALQHVMRTPSTVI